MRCPHLSTLGSVGGEAAILRWGVTRRGVTKPAQDAGTVAEDTAADHQASVTTPWSWLGRWSRTPCRGAGTPSPGAAPGMWGSIVIVW